MAFHHLLLFSCSLFLISSVQSEVFNVGGDNLWSDGVAYDLWSQNYTYHVGDILEFKYTIGEHNVYEVTKATYQSCDASTGALAKYESGDDKITLKAARQYWFICNIEGHCLGGMRFGIKVANASTSSTNSSSYTQSQMGNNASHPPSLSPPGNDAIRLNVHTISVHNFCSWSRNFALADQIHFLKCDLFLCNFMS